MKMMLVPLLVSLLHVALAASPIAKVLSMVSDLQAKVISEGDAAQKQYQEFAEWCEDRSSNLGFEIKTGKSEVNTLQSAIAKQASTIASLTTKVEELVAELSTDQADLKAATQIREKEQASFAVSEKDLVETIDMLGRASIMLEREMKGGASMLQLQSAKNLEQALSVLVQASLTTTADASKLTAFVQSMQQENDGDVGAPAGEVYTSHSGSILNTLQDLKDKADGQLEALRSKETANTNNFEMLKQSLEDEISYGNKELAEAKKGISESAEKKATAEGDLSVTSTELAEDLKAKSTLHHDCMTKAENFEAETKSRSEELAALAKAKQIIKEATSLSQVSLLQTSRVQLASGADLTILESVRFVRDFAEKQHSRALAQLAVKMTSVMHGRGHDQFKKIKGLIRDMITKLESEAEADASKKAWCDRNLADARQRKSEKTNEISKLTTKIDMMSSKSAQLKGEIAALQEQLAKLAQSQVKMDTLRQEEKAAYSQSRADLEKGLEGLKMALKVLTEYYASDKDHDSADGAASGIIGLLEVCESDFTRDLAHVMSDEESAVAEYEKVSKENEIEKTTKTQDVKYKTKEAKRLDEDSSELSGDRSTAQAELDATEESLAKLEEQCIDKAETYAQRKARHAAEIAGLKEALAILESETALLQKRLIRRQLRGRPVV
jgi:hypothetical protein